MKNGLVRPPDAESRRRIITFFVLGMPVVLAAILAIAMSQGTGTCAAIGICTLILLTAGTAGGGFGFLFALPRILTKDDAAVQRLQSPDAKELPKTKQRLLGSNTNLDRVSDWLTTMIVGVGLSQLGSINGKLYEFRLFLQDTIRVFPDSNNGNAGVIPAVGPMILVFGLVFGFLFVYLYTRVIISSLLNSVEKDLTLHGEAAVAFRDLAQTVRGVDENPALRSFSTTEEPSIYEGIELMGSLLYEPGRYQDVIRLSGTLSNTSAPEKAEYWLYSAAAFGQKHHDLLKSREKTDPEVVSSRDNVMDCSRRAVRIDPSMKTRLWYISDPNGNDDDLQDFRDDEEFLKITGRWKVT